MKGLKEQAKMKKTMDEWKHGTLHSGSKKGPVVTDQRQAIGLNQARKAHGMAGGTMGIPHAAGASAPAGITHSKPNSTNMMFHKFDGGSMGALPKGIMHSKPNDASSMFHKFDAGSMGMPGTGRVVTGTGRGHGRHWTGPRQSAAPMPPNVPPVVPQSPEVHSMCKGSMGYAKGTIGQHSLPNTKVPGTTVDKPVAVPSATHKAPVNFSVHAKGTMGKKHTKIPSIIKG